MKCPFELPVVKKPDFDFDKTGLYRVESANTLFLSFSLKEDEVNYIVQAINSHELFKEVARYLWENGGDKDLVDRTIEALKEKP